MFKKSYLTGALLTLLLILAACSSTDDNQNDDKEKDNSGQEVNEEIENDDEGNIEDDKDNHDSENGTEEEDENTNEGADSVDPEQNADKESDNLLANAQQVDSDAQDFTMQILPMYSLTSEEPGRDSLYLTEDGNIFMRIETLPNDAESYDFFKENIVSLLEAVSADGNAPTELTDEDKLPQGENIENAIGYTVDTAEGVTSGIVFERNNLLVRLTIFDDANNNHFNNFLKMGETITSK